MKHLKPFNNFERINEEEGWKENILVGLLSLIGVAGMGQTNKGDVSKRTYHTQSEQVSKNMIKRGWSLDSTQIDTLWKEVQTKKPDTLIMVSNLMLDKDQLFASGKFDLSIEMKDAISESLNNILDTGGVITDVEIVSSTDKQGLSQNLQKLLKSLGYTPDNQGLSKARSNSVSDYLQELGVNNTLIGINNKYEEGEQEIEQSARYVSIDIHYMVVDKDVTPGEVTKVPQVKKTYYLSKETPKNTYTHKTGTYKFKGGFKKVKKLGPIKSQKRKHKFNVAKCTQPGS